MSSAVNCRTDRFIAIDDDCGADRDFMIERIDAAFALARDGMTELRKTPINEDIDNVFQQLFGYKYNERPYKVIEGRLDNLQAISTLDGDAQGTTDVRFFCTMHRIEKRNDKRYYNKDLNVAYELGTITNRFSSCFDLTPPTLAVTLNVPNHRTEIQICPWFMTTARGFKFRDLKELRASSWSYGVLAKILMPPISAIKYTPIDAFALMDKVILHELTHTTASGGRTPAEDMSDDPYGWKNCKKLAADFLASGINGGLPSVAKDPQNNADTIALMCSAIRLIKDGVRVKEDGSLDPKQSSKKRDGVMYPVTWVA
ncbi:uncharacterized protein EI97DRAFT_461869 [Westerdykella ornata]|uniref:Lysine-specific metallo-endopeptidase domain-containing protein n=1 Tax=Westerdykella ornata TaxID=318751 RepID=A0A6A6J8N8_WESOR|nr:uncharacterized protein EI97DRAFT_461869 [Westerdykella ornata]KAF2272617.1 hypothetical protein EI97DRAFT_461869 [Westerdykella ornata]